MKRIVAKVLTVSTLMVLGGLGLAAPASAHTCGQVLMANNVLDIDVGPCPNGGIVIGADNITFDLNGHRIFGTGGANDKAGVSLKGRTGVTVKNGTVTDFDIGVAIEGGSANTVSGITARHNIGGGGGIGGDGIAILSSTANRVLGNKTVDNGPYSGIGVYSRVDGDHPRTTTGVSRNNLVDGNSVQGNIISRDRTTPLGTDNDGIRVENDGASNTFSNNLVLNNGLDGVSLFADTANNVVRANNVQHNGFYRTTARRGSGIIVFTRSTGNVVENNSVSLNADSGIDIRPPLGANPGALNGRIVGNTSVGNSALPFIPSVNFGPSFDLKDGNLTPPCDNNTWFGNRYRTFNQPCVTAGGQRV